MHFGRFIYLSRFFQSEVKPRHRIEPCLHDACHKSALWFRSRPVK